MGEIWSSQTDAEEGYPKLAKFIIGGESGPFISKCQCYNCRSIVMTVVFELEDEYQDNRQRTDSEQIEPRSQSGGQVQNHKHK